jgi:hypothetical protein
MTPCIGKSNRSAMTSAASAQRIIEDRILARHRRIAERLAHDPGLIDHAKSNLQRWAAIRGDDVPPTWLVEWQKILDGPVDDVVAILTERTEHAIRLRSCSPFAGALSPQERWQLIKEAPGAST